MKILQLTADTLARCERRYEAALHRAYGATRAATMRYADRHDDPLVHAAMLDYRGASTAHNAAILTSCTLNRLSSRSLP